MAHGCCSGIQQVAPVCTSTNTCFLRPTRVHNPIGISIGSAIFAQLIADAVGHVLSPKNCPSHGDLDPHRSPSNTWFLGPTRVLSILIGTTVFAGLTTVTD